MTARRGALIVLLACLCGVSTLAGGPVEDEGWIEREGLGALTLGGFLRIEPLEIEEYRTGEDDENPVGRRVTLRFQVAEGAAPEQTAVVDGDIDTAWVEGAPGDGVGETPSLEFIPPLTLHNVALLPGYCASPEPRLANGRPAGMRLELSDGTVLEREPPDTPLTSVLRLDEPHRVRRLSLTILEVHPGARWDDTAVSKVTINYNEGYQPPRPGRAAAFRARRRWHVSCATRRR